MILTTEILDLRPYLFRIAYNMLGVIEEAEDVVQDVFEKWLSAQHVREQKAYLARMTINSSINRLNELNKQRESYIGPWLPEPYITLDPDPSPTIEYGLLFLLERLNPFERAVFILRESFNEEYATIAGLTGLSADNCRQLLHRAHEKLGRNKNQQAEPASLRAQTEALLLALQQQDRQALDQLLKSDIELFSDGGGKRAAALKPLMGFEKVLKFILGVAQLPDNQADEFEYRPAFANGLPAALLFRRSTGDLDSMSYVVADSDGIARLLYLRNPDKLYVRGSMQK